MPPLSFLIHHHGVAVPLYSTHLVKSLALTGACPAGIVCAATTRTPLLVYHLIDQESYLNSLNLSSQPAVPLPLMRRKFTFTNSFWIFFATPQHFKCIPRCVRVAPSIKRLIPYSPGSSTIVCVLPSKSMAVNTCAWNCPLFRQNEVYPSLYPVFIHHALSINFHGIRQ